MEWSVAGRRQTMYTRRVQRTACNMTSYTPVICNMLYTLHLQCTACKMTSYTGWTPSTGCGSECVSRCISVYTTWHLDTCRHSANLCPAFLVAVTYAQPQLVVVNWTSPVSICPRRPYGWQAFAYAGPTSWNSLPDNLKNVNLSLQSFERHLKTFFFSSY